jgi:hypothetical protein
VCQCNQTLNLLARSEYFRLETNIDPQQLILDNFFTPPYNLTLIKSRPIIPTMTFTLIKGPVDITSIRTSAETGEFNATIVTTSNGIKTSETITSKHSAIDRCFFRVSSIKLEFIQMISSPEKRYILMNLTTCEHTLRKFYFQSKSILQILI